VEWVVAFGGMGKGKITGIGKIVIPSLAFINNILYVEGLNYNLLSKSILGKGLYCVLQQRQMHSQDWRWQVLLHYQTTQESIWDWSYRSSKQNVTCLLSREDERWIWQKKLGHVNLKHFKIIQKGFGQRTT